MTKWFVTTGDFVRGPFSFEEISLQIERGVLPPDALLWSRELKSWVSLRDWQKHSKEWVKHSDEKAKSSDEWYYASKGQTYGPVTFRDLISKLKLIPQDVSHALVWKQGMKSWCSIFEFSEILKELDLNQRRFDRAEVSGRVRVQINNLEFLGELDSLSTGGFGAQSLPGLTSGNQVVAIIESDFFKTITVKAEVRYTTPAGGVGFKYTSINREDSAQIQALIKTLSNKSPKLSQAA